MEKKYEKVADLQSDFPLTYGLCVMYGAAVTDMGGSFRVDPTQPILGEYSLLSYSVSCNDPPSETRGPFPNSYEELVKLFEQAERELSLFLTYHHGSLGEFLFGDDAMQFHNVLLVTVENDEGEQTERYVNIRIINDAMTLLCGLD